MVRSLTYRLGVVLQGIVEDVNSGVVNKLKRPHGKAKSSYGRIHFFRSCYTLLKNSHQQNTRRSLHSINNKARNIFLNPNRNLTDALDKFYKQIHDFVASFFSPYHLNEPHQDWRVEEVQTGKLLRP